MSKTRCKQVNCIAFRRLAEIQMSPFARQSAAFAMRDAELIADAVIWVKKRIASVGALCLKPGLKHWQPAGARKGAPVMERLSI